MIDVHGFNPSGYLLNKIGGQSVKSMLFVHSHDSNAFVLFGLNIVHLLPLLVSDVITLAKLTSLVTSQLLLPKKAHGQSLGVPLCCF